MKSSLKLRSFPERYYRIMHVCVCVCVCVSVQAAKNKMSPLVKWLNAHIAYCYTNMRAKRSVNEFLKRTYGCPFVTWRTERLKVSNETKIEVSLSQL